MIEIVFTVLIGIIVALAGPGGTAKAQAPSLVQPWGLPPLPPGIGPVEKFADVSNTPQGQFLEGGSLDTQGNLWFVAIGSGWVSYLTPDGKLVPVFNCNPPADPGQTCEPQGTRWRDGKIYLATRHRGILVYDPHSDSRTIAARCAVDPNVISSIAVVGRGPATVHPQYALSLRAMSRGPVSQSATLTR